jgi:hypothetical protein
LQTPLRNFRSLFYSLGVSNGNRARLDRIARALASLDQDLREDRERMFDEAATRLFEVCPDEGVVDFVQGTRELFAVAPSPFLVADEPTNFATGEMNLTSDRLAGSQSAS